MIQKIKLLQQELAAEVMSGDGEAMHQQQTVRKLPIGNVTAKIYLIEKFDSILVRRVVFYCKFPAQQWTEASTPNEKLAIENETVNEIALVRWARANTNHY